MKYIFFSFFLMAICPVLTIAQTFNLENGISHTSVIITDGCRATRTHDGYAASLSVDYSQKKYWYISSRIGYLTTGYMTYAYDYLGRPDKRIDFITNDLRISTTLRGKLPFHPFFIYMGLGPQIDFVLNRHGHTVRDASDFETNSFNNMLGVEIDFGVCVDMNKFRLGLNGSYSNNLNRGAFDTSKYIYNISIGYKLF